MMERGDNNIIFLITPDEATEEVAKIFEAPRLHVSLMPGFSRDRIAHEHLMQTIKQFGPIEFSLEGLCPRNSRIVQLKCLNERFNEFAKLVRSTAMRGAYGYEMKVGHFLPPENNFHILFPRETNMDFVMGNVKKIRATSVAVTARGGIVTSVSL